MGVYQPYLVAYVTDFLRICTRRKCTCGNHISCGYEHEPCGYFYAVAEDAPARQDVPRSQLHYICHCPTTLDDDERLLLIFLAHYGGETYEKIPSLAQILARSPRQTTRIIRKLRDKWIIQSLSCKSAGCSSHHRSKHMRLSLSLPGMLSFDALYGDGATTKRGKL